MTSRIEGLDLFKNVLAAAPQRVKDAVREANLKSAQALAERIRTTCPDETGQLQSTVRVVAGRSEVGFGVMVGDDKHRYATAIEYGYFDYGVKKGDQGKVKSEGKGHHVPARPFFWPSVKLMRPSFRNRMRYAIRTAFKGYVAAGGQDD